jgi:hypothetical protein
MRKRSSESAGLESGFRIGVTARVSHKEKGGELSLAALHF